MSEEFRFNDDIFYEIFTLPFGRIQAEVHAIILAPSANKLNIFFLISLL